MAVAVVREAADAVEDEVVDEMEEVAEEATSAATATDEAATVDPRSPRTCSN